jgi:1,4-dihydroxy-2-naphthoate octaprenyltransferase
MDIVSKWLYLTRAGVLPMTLVAAGVAGLLAVFRDANVNWAWFALAALGIVLSHMANNLMNDLFDLEVGTDRPDYPRNLYSPHPVLSGVISRRGLAGCALVVNACCLAIMIVLTAARGWAIPAFALSGFVLSAAYTAPPLRLKKHGLGEPTVLVVWGPLMVGGTYYAAAGQIPAAVILASLPYALLCTTVLMGKHIDKIPWDRADGTHTLPVLLGEARARRVTQAMFAGFFLSIVALVAATGWALLAAVVGSSWLLGWYVIWPLPFAAMAGDRRLKVASLALVAYFVANRWPILVLGQG